MDPRSGKIIENPSEEQIREDKLIPIPSKEIELVRAMSRSERRAWARKKAKKQGEIKF